LDFWKNEILILKIAGAFLKNGNLEKNISKKRKVRNYEI